MKTEHEVLVEARNGAARDDGYAVTNFGVWENDSDCGTPRCMLGWCAWESGIRIPNTIPAYFLRWRDDERLPSVYVEAVEALWQARPYNPAFAHASACDSTLEKVEAVAYTIGDLWEDDPDRERVEVLAWFDRAISLTAPAPADPFEPSERLDPVAVA